MQSGLRNPDQISTLLPSKGTGVDGFYQSPKGCLIQRLLGQLLECFHLNRIVPVLTQT